MEPSDEASREAGNEALGNGEFARAVEIYSRALVADPEDEKLYSNRSLAHYRQDNFKAAIADADEAIRLKPTWERGYVRKALAMEKAGASDEEVLAVYEKGALEVPHSMLLARAVVGLRERVILDALPPSTSDAKEEVDADAEDGEKEESRVSWREDEIARHYAERGVMYARMKIDQPDTPFLVYDEDLARDKNLIGTVTDKSQPPEFVDIDALREKLGLVQVAQQEQQEQQRTQLQEEQCKSQEGQRGNEVSATSDFESKRKQIYRVEGDVFRSVQGASAAAPAAASASTNDEL
ncbi:Tetratricopeptide repeat protein 1 [Hondaea fermentalgiana]|uniref:Tetratricopeptide repeat protein 1 n=1 Tax=Hondaea fermentalgiana TaxID=2315210 RepID=A0A2R5GNL0_9STRA|nr:Tetratricopeptide repeat protein 1 [Hondaea fermentalgiana]|eukprot:GBG31328.1 Tetratricopeptide repeat protein 1 [Hondaea fermentalgiana]